jgi:hypothetical protein
MVFPDEVDAGPLLGAWTNTNAGSGQIAGLRIEVIDDRPALSVWGVSPPSHRNWGTTPIDRLYRGNLQSLQAAAFEATFEAGSMTALLDANLSKGLLIIACMKSFRDGSGRSNYFVREFFRKTDQATPAAMAAVDQGRWPVYCSDDEVAPGPKAAGSPRLDPALFLGRWSNTDESASNFREVRMSARGVGLELEFRCAGPKVEEARFQALAELYSDSTSGTAATQFQASIKVSGDCIRMHGWVKLGVLVIAIFRRAEDSAAGAPWFDREFFYQADRP